MKKFLLLATAMICAVSMAANQINDTTNTAQDTLRMDTSMFRIAEVTVEAQSVIQKVDKQVLLPNREQRKASHDGMSLLQNLQIPRIVVNPVENSVKTLTNQEVQLRINGIEASSSEVMAINPKMSSVSSTTTSRVCALTEQRRSSTTSSSTATRAAI